MKILFTICGRAGSKGLKNKNLKYLNGVPLVYYTLAAIRLYSGAHLEDEIVTALNTDSEDLVNIVRGQTIVKDVVIVKRAKGLEGDLVPKVDVIKSTWESLGRDFESIIDLDITSPMRRLSDIENAINAFKSNVELDLVFSVVDSRRNPYFNMVERTPDGELRRVCDLAFTARQQAPKCYDLNASIYVYNPSFLLKKIDKPILNYTFDISIMPDYRVLDIDSEDDFNMMEIMINHFMYSETQIMELVKTACEKGTGNELL